MYVRNCEQGRLVTLSITRPATIYTTTVQLKSSINCGTNSQQQTIVTPTTTAGLVANQTPASNHYDNDSVTTIGITVGCISLGALLLLLASCCIPPQQKKSLPRPIAVPRVQGFRGVQRVPRGSRVARLTRISINLLFLVM